MAFFISDQECSHEIIMVDLQFLVNKRQDGFIWQKAQIKI